MTANEEIQLAATDAQALSRLHAIAVRAAQGLMEQVPLQLMKVGGQVLGLEAKGARGVTIRKLAE